MSYQDLIYEIRNGVAWIIINRPDKMNAFRGTTCDELIKALYKAHASRSWPLRRSAESSCQCFLALAPTPSPRG